MPKVGIFWLFSSRKRKPFDYGIANTVAEKRIFTSNLLSPLEQSVPFTRDYDMLGLKFAEDSISVQFVPQRTPAYLFFEVFVSQTSWHSSASVFLFHVAPMASCLIGILGARPNRHDLLRSIGSRAQAPIPLYVPITDQSFVGLMHNNGVVAHLKRGLGCVAMLGKVVTG